MKKVKLGEIADYSDTRINCSDLSFDNYVGTDNIKQNKQGKEFSQYTPTTGFTTEYKKNDILIANIRPYLKKIWFATNDGGSSADVLTIRVNDKDYDSKFVYYNLFQDSFFDWAMSGSKGTKMPRGDKNQILAFPVSDFDLPTQIAIAKVLSLLDDKIELNNKINKELEATAKELYDYWFVQNADEGWERVRLEEIEPNIITGKTPSTNVKEYFNGTIPFICIGDLRNNMHVIYTEQKLSVLGADTQKNKYIPEGTICVSCIATPGLISFSSEKSQTNQQLNSIVCKNEENKYYLYFYLQDYFKNAKAKTGNTFANMNKEEFSNIVVIVPNNNLLKTFSEKVKPFIQLVLSNARQNIELAQLRDFLLPLLMNGQVRVGK